MPDTSKDSKIVNTHESTEWSILDLESRCIHPRLRPHSAESFVSLPQEATSHTSAAGRGCPVWGDDCTEAASGFKPVFRL